MQTEIIGRYALELSARQWIHNGGWAAFAAIHMLTDDDGEDADALPDQELCDEAVFQSEEAALAGARRAALAFLRLAV